MQIPICQICKEPIWTFICPSCLVNDISKWLPNKISGDFLKFSNNLMSYFSNSYEDLKLPCIHCKQSVPATVCTFCYIKETTEWLKGKNKDLANKLTKMMSLAKVSRGFQPVTEIGNDIIEEGICEYCGVFSNGLKLKNGKWICEECEDIDY